MLNSEQILERNVLKLEHSKGKPAQIGYDLSVKEIKRVGPNMVSSMRYQNPGQVLVKETKLTDYHHINLSPVLTNEDVIEIDDEGNESTGPQIMGYFLDSGYYEVTFWEGCNIPNNLVGLIRQRSSMLRNGALLHSSVFDPGFGTEFMGSFIAVFCPIFIEQDARIAQIYFHECEPVVKGYDGQFQNDKQRKV